jgi:hypothetical protein
MTEINDFIDDEHPVWIELCKTVSVPSYMTKMNESKRRWISYIKYFTKDEMMLFIEAYPNAVMYIKNVIVNILEYVEELEDMVKLLESLLEAWGCSYDKFEEFDCIAVCLTFMITSRTIPLACNLVEYFLDKGSTFKKHHTYNAVKFGEPMIQLMLDNGVNLNDITAAFFQRFRDTNSDQFKTLKFLSQTNADLYGHIQETN